MPFVVQLTTSHRHHAPAKCQVDSLLRPRSVESESGASPGATRYLILVRAAIFGPAPGRTWTAATLLSGGQGAGIMRSSSRSSGSPPLGVAITAWMIVAACAETLAPEPVVVQSSGADQRRSRGWIRAARSARCAPLLGFRQPSSPRRLARMDVVQGEGLVDPEPVSPTLDGGAEAHSDLRNGAGDGWCGRPPAARSSSSTAGPRPLYRRTGRMSSIPTHNAGRQPYAPRKHLDGQSLAGNGPPRDAP